MGGNKLYYVAGSFGAYWHEFYESETLGLLMRSFVTVALEVVLSPEVLAVPVMINGWSFGEIRGLPTDH